MSNPKRARGRPKQPEKTARILEAIRVIVCEEGLVALTMEGVARKAQVSKTTLYRRFSSKQELISHYVLSITQEDFVDELEAEDLPQDPRARLITLGIRLMTFLTREDVIRFDNAIAAAAPRFPEVAKAFAQASLDQVERIIQSALLEAQAAGLFQLRSLPDEASALLGLWGGGFYDRVRFMGTANWPSERIARHIESRTDMFIGYLQ